MVTNITGLSRKHFVELELHDLVVIWAGFCQVLSSALRTAFLSSRLWLPFCLMKWWSSAEPFFPFVFSPFPYVLEVGGDCICRATLLFSGMIARSEQVLFFCWEAQNISSPCLLPHLPLEVSLEHVWNNGCCTVSNFHQMKTNTGACSSMNWFLSNLI